MKIIHPHRLLLTTLMTALLVSGCSLVPLTGRRQINLVSDAQVVAVSEQQYRSFISQAPKSRDMAQTERTREMGKRIASATERYLRSIGHTEDIRFFRWEFNLIASNQVNAFCMPGGKIVVYEGILPVARTDDELATVIAHEVAHAVAKHSNERLSQAILRQYGGQALGQILSGSSAGAQVVGNILYNVGGKLIFELPYSRKQEYEADQIGLYLMALAGYDYHNAPNLWVKMASRSGGGNQSEVISSHPNDQNRIKAIREEIPRVEAFMRSGGKVVPTATPSTSKKVSANKKSKDQGNVPIITHY
ncbi:M48 family metallopeptidase [Porphyromonas sp. HMSC065F10]|uniref:M48 family metallopeptidase n=1 Tax=Porphyromonas sp. HMSC065F10 TaxID=1739394 RepID=UPI0008A33913|nr:M48 family metallopeptidase [Porphyromonas sp. HMSC065F10]OFR33272.1 peptidase M48 family protein [Porphyromonas sp. HMSC065F10]